jgi:hypothetical protein
MSETTGTPRTTRQTKPLNYALAAGALAGVVTRDVWLALAWAKMAPRELDEVEQICWIVIAVATMIGAAVGWPKRLPRKGRALGVMATVMAGVTLGSIVRLANMPADPTGRVTSPVLGGIIGLIVALFVLVLRDNDPWRRSP